MWSGLLAYARVNLNMGRTEFMRLTPRYFARLTKEHREARERSERTVEFMLAQVVAMVANTGFKGWDKPRQPTEFMPSSASRGSGRAPARERRPRKARTDAIRAAMMKLAGL
jgi:hypothetical protein